MLWNEYWIDLISTALRVSCSICQCFIPKKSSFCALIPRIALSDTEMDYIREKSSDLGVNCIDILRTNVL